MKDISYDIIGCALEVHSQLGPGLLESVYQKALAYELRQKGYDAKTEVPVKIKYKDLVIDSDLRVDILVNDSIILELKSVEYLTPLHKKQLLTYLRLMNKSLGLLINFNVVRLKDGVERLVNNFRTD